MPIILSTLLKSNTQRALVARGLILTMLLFFAIAGANRLIISVTAMSEWSAGMFIISRFEYWLWLGLIWLYVWQAEKQPLLLWPEKSYAAPFYFLSVWGIMALIYLGNQGIGYALYYAGLYKFSPAFLEMGRFSFWLKAFISLTAGVVEELVMRGYLMPRLQLFFKKNYMPVVVSTLLFGIAHARWGTLASVLVPMYIGFIFACHYQKYRNIRVLMLCHFLWDMYAFLKLPHGGK